MSINKDLEESDRCLYETNMRTNCLDDVEEVLGLGHVNADGEIRLLFLHNFEQSLSGLVGVFLRSLIVCLEMGRRHGVSRDDRKNWAS